MYPLTRSTSRSRFFGLPFSPASLFAAGEQGFWYDPSDYSTLFQDSAGTTPVTAVEQAVGLMLDKSKNGVGTNGAARYNLLTYSDTFSDAVWDKLNGVTIASSAVTPPITGASVSKLIAPNSTGTGRTLRQYKTTGVNGVSYTSFIYLRFVPGEFQWVRMVATDTGSVWFDVQNGVVGTQQAGVTGTITNAGNGWWRCAVTSAANSVNIYSFVNLVDADNSTTATGDGVKGVLVSAADLRLASQAALTPTYQPITASWSATIPGNHAFQTTSAKRPVLRARYNLLTYSEQFDNAAWSKTGLRAFGSGSVANAIANPVNGAVTADLVVQDTSTGTHQVEIGVGGAFVGAGGIYVKAAGCTSVALLLDNAGGLYHAYFDITPGTAGAVTGNPNTGTPTITALGNDWFLLRILNQTLVAARYFVRMCQNGTNTISFTGDGTNGIYVWGADLRPTSQATGLIGPTYQRIAAATDYDTTGFLPYLQFDGVDDAMTTNSIDFTATDKMTVWAGVRKLSAASTGIPLELSADNAANNGSFLIGTDSGGIEYFFNSRGTTNQQVNVNNAAYDSPVTNVLQWSGNISGPSLSVRINGSDISTNTGSQGTGTYGNYPLFIGQRNQTSFPFNGWLTSLIGRGAATSAGQISATETWVNSKTGAY